FSSTGGAADAANNYEAVFLPAGTTGTIEITVRATNVAGDGVPNSGDGTDQDFGLVVYNGSQEPTFTVTTSNDELAVCSPDDAVYALDVNNVNGYMGTVNLSAVGAPAGATVNFAPPSGSPSFASTLTLGNIPGV